MRCECVAVKLEKINFEVYDQYKSEQESEMSMTITPEFGKSDETQAYRLILSLTIGEKDNRKFPFYFDCKMIGVFKGNDENDDEQMIKECSEILISFIRTYLYDNLERAMINPMVLPSGLIK